jgi:hypothetical protein
MTTIAAACRNGLCAPARLAAAIVHFAIDANWARAGLDAKKAWLTAQT